MLRLIIYRVVRPAVATLMLWLEQHWPNAEDVLDPEASIDLSPTEKRHAHDLLTEEDESLVDWVVRNYDRVPDDARGLT